MAHYQIKRWDTNAVIYEGEAETLADLVGSAVREDKDLYRARLDGASLVGAILVGASLVGASLDGASLVGARLDRARLDGASLDGASLVGASLVGAILVGASLDRGEILSLRVFSGLYRYRVYAYVLKHGVTPCVRMGCHDKTLKEWESVGGIENVNTSEFPRGEVESLRRIRAFEYAKAESLAMVEEAKS